MIIEKRVLFVYSDARKNPRIDPKQLVYFQIRKCKIKMNGKSSVDAVFFLCFASYCILGFIIKFL